MQQVRRYGPTLGLMLALTLILSGCVHADRKVQLNTDGSGSYTFTLGFSDQVLTVGGGNFASQMNRCGDQVRAAGGSYRHFEDSGYGNWAFTWPFKNVGTLNQLLQASSSLCNTGSSPSSAGGSLTASDTDFFKVTETTGWITNTFHATGQMSMLSSAGSTDPSTEQLLKDARESFAITFPGYVSAHAGGILNGNSVTYTIHYGESTTIDATGGGVNTGTVAAATGLALAVLASVVAIFFLMRRRVPAESIPVGFGREYVSVPTLSALGDDEPTVPMTLSQDGQPHSDA